MTRVLVTGGAGFLGSHFVRRWLRAKGGPVVNVDALTYAASEARLADVDGDPGYTFVRADVCDGDQVERVVADFRPDAVVHFAAESHVTRSEAAGSRFWRTNVQGTKTMLEAAHRGGVARFVHVSTDEVYGPIRQGAFMEDQKEPGEGRATSPYARSKAVADDVARSFEEKLDVVVLRPTNCFGSWQFPEKAFPRWVTRALSGRTIPVWGDGLYVRQWLHAEDLAEAVALVLQTASPDRVYNVGPRHSPEVTNLALAEWLMTYLGLPRERLVLTAYDRPDHDRRYAVDPGRIEALGWRPGDLWRGLSATVDWYRQSEAWWRPLVTEAESIYSDEQAKV
ncbi:MAG TPA: NAD-dependent epimerase/dehydratase family protein [Actinomycetota bacterium]|nr:NAD-dependent epimerase/dehydratase family protein [Actinomycetota bacterium]